MASPGTRVDEAVAATAQRDFALRQLARADSVNDLNAFLLVGRGAARATFTAGDLLARAEALVSRHPVDPPSETPWSR